MLPSAQDLVTNHREPEDRVSDFVLCRASYHPQSATRGRLSSLCSSWNWNVVKSGQPHVPIHSTGLCEVPPRSSGSGQRYAIPCSKV